MQRRDEEDGESFEQVVLNGARAIMEDESGAPEHTWDSEAVDTLIVEMENRRETPTTAKTTGFTFAPVYDSKTRITTELVEESEEGRAGEDEASKLDFWDRIAKQNEQEQVRQLAEQYGRGARSKATVSVDTFDCL